MIEYCKEIIPFFGKEFVCGIQIFPEEETCPECTTKKLKAKMQVAVSLIREGVKHSGHFTDCQQEHDDEPCTCGADEFEFQAHIFLTENEKIKAK